MDVDHNVRNAIKQVARGGMIILIDDEDRENEGDLVFAASDVCPEKINFMHAKLHAWYKDVDAKFLQPKSKDSPKPWRP